MRYSSGPLTEKNAIDDLARVFRECPGHNLGVLITKAIAAQDEDDRASVEDAMLHWAKLFITSNQRTTTKE
jgi:hypothetical protein